MKTDLILIEISQKSGPTLMKLFIDTECPDVEGTYKDMVSVFESLKSGDYDLYVNTYKRNK